jgi:hypothetical protein
MDAVADLELGVPQQMGVVLAGQEPGQAQRLGVKAFSDA